MLVQLSNTQVLQFLFEFMVKRTRRGKPKEASVLLSRVDTGIVGNCVGPFNLLP
jgi:hypothetical protein